MNSKVLTLFPEPNPYLQSLDVHYETQVWVPGVEQFRPHDALKTVTLRAGKLFLDGVPILHPKFDQDAVKWNQRTDDSYTCGVLYFQFGGRVFTGVMRKGLNPDEAEDYTINGAIPPSTYTTQVKVSADDDASGSGWKPGVTIELGFERTPNPVPVVKINGNSWPAFTETVNPKNQNLQLHIEYDSELTPIGYSMNHLWPASGCLEFAMDGLSATGSMSPYDSATEAPAPSSYVWKGVLQAPTALRDPNRPAPDPQVVIKEEDLRDIGETLSVIELMTISPEPGQVQSQSFKLLLDNMKWEMNEKWLRDFFGETRPVLDSQMQALAKKGKSFYEDDFAPAYLGWGFANMSGKGAPTTQLTEQQKEKLKYYLHVGLAKNKDYTEQSNGVYLRAYIDEAPRLQQYIDDGGAEWAKKLYDYLMTPVQVNLMVQRVVGADSSVLLNRFSTLLTALQPSGELASSYNQYIVMGTLHQISQSADLNNVEDIMEWLPDVITEFINQYIADPTNPTQAYLVRQQLAKDLQDAAKQVKTTIKLAEAMANALVASQGVGVLEKGESAASIFASKYPKLAKAAKFLKFAGISGGLFYAIVAFRNWKTLTPEEKTSLIAATVSITGSLVAAVPDIVKGASWTLDSIVTVQMKLSGAEILDETMSLFKEDTNWLQRAATSLKNFIANAVEAEDSLFAKFFSNYAKILKYLGPVVSAVFAVLSTMAFVKAVEDKNTPITTEVFDGIIAAADILQTIALAIDLFVATAVFAFAAAILAVIGLVAQLIIAFLPKKNPPSPVETFTKDTLVPFVDRLPAPPKNWNPPSLAPLPATA